MGELTSALDALAADDLHALGSAALLDRTAELVRAVNRLQAKLARTVRVAELTQAPEHDGLTSMRSWLRGRARLSTEALPHWCEPGGCASSCRRWPPGSPTGTPPGPAGWPATAASPAS